MPKRNSRLVLVLVCLLALGEAWLIFGGGTASASVNAKYFFAGVAEDQANKEPCQDPQPPPAPDPFVCDPTSTFEKDAPTDSAPIVQTVVPNCDPEVPANRRCAFWVGPYTGTIDGPVEFCWYWNSATGVAAETQGQVTLWADPDINAPDRVAPDKIIGRAPITLDVGPQPVQVVTTVPVKGTIEKQLLIQVSIAAAPDGSQVNVQYGSSGQPSAFGPPGTACAAAGGSPTPTGTTRPTQTRTATPSPSPTQTGTATSPGVGLKVSDSTPEFGTVVKATGSLKKCPGHQGTKLHLQKKNKKGKFVKVQTKKLDAKCKAVFKIKANFKKATFRASWPKQDQDHKAGKSRPRTIRTHGP